MVEPDIDKHRIGRRELSQWSSLLSNLDLFRNNYSSSSIYDVSMDELQQDPEAVIKGIYDHFSLNLQRKNFDAEIKKIVSNFKRDNLPSQNSHNYTPEEFGLTDEMIKKAFLYDN